MTIFCDNYGSSMTFEKDIWNNLRGDSPYQFDKAPHCASHLKYLQFIPQKVSDEKSLHESSLIHFLENCLRLSISAGIKNAEKEFKNVDIWIWKITAAEKKTRPPTFSRIRSVNWQCLGKHGLYVQANKHQHWKQKKQVFMKDYRKSKLFNWRMKQGNDAHQSEEKKFWLNKKLRWRQE